VEIDAAGDRIGTVLERYLAESSADLLVMGAYGQSKFREFVLGGATAHMLHNPIVPLMLSH
jgi:nucleotide-binding universal stress UspA family protein